MQAAGSMTLNHTHLVTNNNTIHIPKSSIYELDSQRPDFSSVAKNSWLPEMLADREPCVMLSLLLPNLTPPLSEQTLKAQHNLGRGGGFPLHFDTSLEVDSRKVTCILYLNEHWQPDHGGELVLDPYPYPPVVVPPTAGTVVLFSSANTLHAVRPTFHERSCVTLWLSNPSRTPTRKRTPGAVSDLDRMKSMTPEQIVRDFETRKLLSHVMRAEDWADSIAWSHESEHSRIVSDSLFKNVEKIRNAMPMSVEAMRALAQDQNWLRSLGHLQWIG
eukprot:c16730_g1_i3.p1 GENE.c16730_g1_i3~~c16730_g1_i3.p1  ORF type:complete len:274 (+),score=58.93 c16730_g1_i3:308-1129(+)